MFACALNIRCSSVCRNKSNNSQGQYRAPRFLWQCSINVTNCINTVTFNLVFNKNYSIKIKKESTKLTVWNFVQNAAKVVVNENQEDNDEETKNEM